MNKGSMVESKNGFTLDSCVVIKICENPNLANLLACRINFEDSPVYLNSQTVYELQNHGYSLDKVYKILRTTLGTTIVYEEITEEIKNYAIYLQSIYPTLHAGDAEILAFSQTKSTTLVSCDKGLLKAAKSAKTEFVNPDILPCDEIAKKTKTKFYSVIKNAVKTSPSQIKSIANKPAKKIIWRSFV